MKNALIENKARTRLLNFRLSSEETELLIQSARDSGARTVSEYVRAAVMDRAARDAGTGLRKPRQLRGAGAGDSGEFAVKFQHALTALEDVIRATRQEIAQE